MVSIETALLRTLLYFYPQSFSHLAYFNGGPCVHVWAQAANKLANTNTNARTHKKTNLFVLHRNKTNIMEFQKLCHPKKNKDVIRKFLNSKNASFATRSIVSPHFHKRAKEIGTFHQISIISTLETKNE